MARFDGCMSTALDRKNRGEYTRPYYAGSYVRKVYITIPSFNSAITFRGFILRCVYFEDFVYSPVSEGV